jgi:hypothetical protein
VLASGARASVGSTVAAHLLPTPAGRACLGLDESERKIKPVAQVARTEEEVLVHLVVGSAELGGQGSRIRCAPDGIGEELPGIADALGVVGFERLGAEGEVSADAAGTCS